MEPLYSTPAGGIRLFDTIVRGLALIEIVVAVLLVLFDDAMAGVILFVSTTLALVLVWLILPRRYEVWRDHLRIVFPAWGWDIPYKGIDTVRDIRWYEAYGFAGWRFATSPGQSVTILRHKANMFTHPNIVISPSNREEFLRQLERAMGRTGPESS
jgi:hypothetical protein